MPAKSSVAQHKLPYHDQVAYTLSDARLIRLFGEVSLSSMAHVVNSLDYMIRQDKRKPIHILLNSPGGSVVDGLAIYDAITYAAKATPIHITVQGACMSMGAVILQAGTTRRSYEHSEFLLHEVSYGSMGRHSDHRDREKQAARMQEVLDGILIKRSTISATELRELIDRKDYTISAQEALTHGLIDEIVR